MKNLFRNNESPTDHQSTLQTSMQPAAALNPPNPKWNQNALTEWGVVDKTRPGQSGCLIT